jgi:hypothetical protein
LGIVYFGQLDENYRSGLHKYLGYFIFLENSYVLMLARNGLGYTLGYLLLTRLVTLAVPILGHYCKRCDRRIGSSFISQYVEGKVKPKFLFWRGQNYGQFGIVIC